MYPEPRYIYIHETPALITKRNEEEITTRNTVFYISPRRSRAPADTSTSRGSLMRKFRERGALVFYGEDYGEITGAVTRRGDYNGSRDFRQSYSITLKKKFAFPRKISLFRRSESLRSKESPRATAEHRGTTRRVA